MDRYHVKLTLTRPLVGTVSKDPEVYGMLARAVGVPEEQLARELELLKAELKDLAAAQPNADEDDAKAPAAPTGFLRVEGQPVLLSHTIKGYFKDAAEAGLSSELRAAAVL